jgi:hypothetical protein
MLNTGRVKVVDREREQIQNILDYHNRKYSVRIKGGTAEVYPQLVGNTVWGWVCYDPASGEEIALSVKRLGEGVVGETEGILRVVLSELENSLAGKLGGTFSLYLYIPSDYRFPTRDDKIQCHFCYL